MQYAQGHAVPKARDPKHSHKYSCAEQFEMKAQHYVAVVCSTSS